MEDFKTKLLSTLQQLAEKVNCTVTVQDVLKVNDILKHAISIRNASQNICCNYYLEDLYEEFMNNSGVSIEEIAKRIFTHSQEKPSFASSNALTDLISNLSSYEMIKPNIMVKLINFKKNSEYLKDKFYLPFIEDEDNNYELAICFIALVSDDNEGAGSFVIPNSTRAQWKDVDDDTILRDAISNMNTHYGFYISDIFTLLCKLASSKGEDIQKLLDEASRISDPTMYVLSNQSSYFGASTLLFPDVLKEFANSKESDLYILPSSISEVILIPAVAGVNPQELESMIPAVNRSQVPPTEVLSDRLFYYSRDTDQISIYSTED